MPRAIRYRELYEGAQFLLLLSRDLERVSAQQDPSRVIRMAVRRLGEYFHADLAVQVDVRRADGGLERPFALGLSPRGQRLVSGPAESGFLEECRAFLRRPIGPADHTRILLRVLNDDRPEAVLALFRPGRKFSRRETQLGQAAAEILSENLRHRERERAQAMRERIYAKILGEIRPQDVLYQILHGLKRLLQYDHRGAVLLVDPDQRELAVRAEIIAWTKAKSERIGQRLPLTEELRSWIEANRRPVLLRADLPSTDPPQVDMVDPGAGGAAVPPCLRRELTDPPPGTPPARAMIVAVLRHRGDTLGILQLRSTSLSAFAPSDLRLLEEFLPLASLTLHNSTLYKTQHDLLLTAERRTALAVLARAIAHDLANAFTVMLPLLQQMRVDVGRGEAGTTSLPPSLDGLAPQPKATDRERLARDLEVLEHYARSSSRIFQGLLSMAKGVQEPAAWIDPAGVLESIQRMLGPSLHARRIELRREVEGTLPKVFARRGDLEQVILNLVYNARDAMPDGGALTLRARGRDDGVEIAVIDTGHGMTEEVKRRIFEPFFTTKRAGSGLGLDICRSILWDYDGRIELDSEPGRGTVVTIWLPRVAERLASGRSTRGPADGI